MIIRTFKIEKSIQQDHIVLFPTLLQVDGKNYLVDCGYQETFQEFLAALEDMDIKPIDLHAIIISHDDIDHLGALHLFKTANPKLLVYCSQPEESSISGKTKSERLQQAENILPHMGEEHKEWAMNFIQQLKAIKRVAVDVTVEDKDRIEQDIVVITTPGHTRGHISLYIPIEKTVIANDAVVIENGELNIANPDFTLDIKAAIESVEKLRNINPETLICYHGGVINDNVPERLEQLAKRYRNKLLKQKADLGSRNMPAQLK
jgi:glyoxylase-like metal-dependent hydrolase (beta-lactamase superfamily II)